MKKWIILSLLFVVSLSLSAFIYIYGTARSPLVDIEKYAEDRAKKEAKIEKIDDIYLYNGSETYYVVVGDYIDGTKIAVWISEKEDQKVEIKKLTDGISKEAAISKLYEEENPQKLLGVRLGKEKDLAVWELSYLDDNSNLNYYYIHFDSGKWWRKIENL